MGIKSTANAELWATRVQDFMNSGITRKVWCQEHQLSVSTLGYWIRKQQRGSDSLSEQEDKLVFARLPFAQEIIQNTSSHATAPITIYMTGSIRIELAADCPVHLLSVLLGTLGSYA